ncbi:hypothetical protein SK128_007331 [Halocaridina rubra]|uniref:Innexin n=1 Tax=Halocaridina rubra TaxID=373956 RepID=A0AAN8X735_HALRR
MVFHIFSALVGLVKVRLDHANIDSHVFRLHYRWTTSLCFISCALVVAVEYIGDPIQCMTNTDAPAEKAINTYCWISSTFTINSTEKEGAIPGLGQEQEGYHERTYHSYYQWVPFILFFQGCLFYLPHLIWKANEGKTVNTILQGLHENSLDKDIDKKKENIIKYLKESQGRNNKYSLVYFICEILNLVNVLGQIVLMDAFFNNNFLRYGFKVVQYAVEQSDEDPFQTVFPKVTKCTFRRYGPSGTLNVQQPICILPQNILNQKVFIILWFWFVILSTITCMQLVWRLIVSASPIIRVRIMERRGKIDANSKLEKAIQRLHLGDFYLLDILGHNLDALTFWDIFVGATKDMDPNVDNVNYKPVGMIDEEDDPIVMKRRMELIDGASV